MRFDDRRIRRVIASPRRDVGEGIDLTILDEDRLRGRRLGDDDLPASQRNRGRADADAALPAPGGEWAVLGHDRRVGGGEGGDERLGRCPRCRGKRLADRAQGNPGELHSSRGKLDRLDAGKQDPAKPVRDRGDVGDAGGICRRSTCQCETDRGHAGAAHGPSPPRPRPGRRNVRRSA